MDNCDALKNALERELCEVKRGMRWSMVAVAATLTSLIVNLYSRPFDPIYLIAEVALVGACLTWWGKRFHSRTMLLRKLHEVSQ